MTNSKKRKFLILNRLLNDEHLSYQHLAEDYYVSRSSIANDISYIKELLAQDNVSLQFDNTGTFIKCSEIKKQNIIKRIVSLNFINLNQSSEYESLFLDLALLKKINKIIDSKNPQIVNEIPDIYLQNLILTFAILIQRGKANHHISFSDEDQLAMQSQLNDYPLIDDLIESVQDSNIYHFSKDELIYLTYLILGNSNNFFVNYARVPPNIKTKVENFIDEVSRSLNIDLSGDKSLREDLTIHIYQMMLRLKSESNIVNPLKEEIKEDYSQTYGVIWYLLKDFGNENHLQISEDEVSFITIHFQAAIERKKKYKKILFVCPQGIGTSSLAVAQLRKIIPREAAIEIISLQKLNHRDLQDTDLIVSTIPISISTVPVVQISPILTSKDMKKIMDSYIDTTMNKDTEEKCQYIISIKHEVLLSKEIDKESVLNKLSLLGNWRNDDDRLAFLKSTLAREKLQSTYLGNGFVIPHGDTKYVNKSLIAIDILNRPIEWGNHKADIICLLMINSKDRDEVEPFMKMVMNGIKNKNWFKKKVMKIG